MILMLWLLAAAATSPQSKSIVENDRVAVREVRSAVAQPIQASADREAVVVFLSDGKVGDVAFEKKGASLNGTRAIIVELKDRRMAPYANTSGYPNAFPRPR